jgi:hypothetical protein
MLSDYRKLPFGVALVREVYIFDHQASQNLIAQNQSLWPVSDQGLSYHD